ncbi:MAG TPA: heterodisulfide reductase-related iron-sulfur binding cluster [Caulobacteraceae bacterium]|nr:heterodisulfide reductase-related iron-sulfur binding cluster [Caulobacteraceae bacterium]
MSSTPTPPPGAREGSLEAPTRHPLEWRDPKFYDQAALAAELERVFDICHGCRRCFSLCNAFPTLFDAVDGSKDGEVAGLDRQVYWQVVDHCYLCDMCFMTKCPYVPPHEFNVDFPHLMLRHRAAERKHQGGRFVPEQLGQTDRNGKLAKPVAGLANWATALGNKPVRALMETVAGIDREAALPLYHARTAEDLCRAPAAPNPQGPAFGKRKALVYATCFVDYNNPATATAAMAVLAHLGVDARLDYPACCGMPQLEAGDIAAVAHAAERLSAHFLPLIEQGHDIIALTASCGLMMKFEWPLILPENAAVKRLAAATRDISEYVVAIAKNDGLTPGLKPVEGGVAVHHACHARAQNMGAKSAELLRLIPDTKVDLIERCSGHGGTFGVMKQTRPMAVKVGKPAARQVAQKKDETLCSDCPLACKHLGQLLSVELADGVKPPVQAHPIEVFARAYGLA